MTFFGTPEEIAAQLQEAKDKHAMVVDEAAHGVISFLRGLDLDGLMCVLRIVTVVANSGANAVQTATWYSGLIEGLADAGHGRCVACSKNHDDELSNVVSPAPPTFPGAH